MERHIALQQLKSLIEEGETVLATNHYIDGVIGGPFVNSDVYVPWRSKAAMLLREVLPDNQQKPINQLDEKNSNHTSLARQWQGQLKAASESIEQGIIILEDSSVETVDEVIERILESFPEVVDSINRRHNGRPGFVVEDEYDVQDLLKSVCIAFFDDVRDEEAVPSFAGKNSRVDLFLKDESRFIEVKMTRDGLKDKKLGEELSVDIPQYKEHPGCERLYCFVYDPGRFIKNPKGLARDLEKIDSGFVTVVIVR